jgi:vitamin uptake sensor VUPS-like protein
MDPNQVDLKQIGILFGEGALISITLLFFYRLRNRMGISLVLGALVLLQFPQHFLTTFVAVEVYPGLRVSPGTIVLFPANLLVVLLLYARRDPIEWRRLCVVLLCVNVFAFLISLVTSCQIRNSGIADDQALRLLRECRWTILINTMLLLADIVVLIMCFDLAYFLPFPLRAAVSMAVPLLVDGIIFGALTDYIWGTLPNHQSAYFLSKALGSTFYAFTLSLYLWWWEGISLIDKRPVGWAKYVVYLFRRRHYKSIVATRIEGSSGLYSRDQLFSLLDEQLLDVERVGTPVSLITIQLVSEMVIRPDVLDSFWTEVNDVCRQWHVFPCRYNDRIAAVLLPNMDSEQAQKIINIIAHHSISVSQFGLSRQLPGITFGCCTVNSETTDAYRAQSVIGMALESQVEPDVWSDLGDDRNLLTQSRPKPIVKHMIGEHSYTNDVPDDDSNHDADLGAGDVLSPAKQQILLSVEASFRADLPKLLQTHPGEWVAYCGNHQCAFAKSTFELVKICDRLGIPKSEVHIRLIEPQLDDIFVGPR